MEIGPLAGSVLSAWHTKHDDYHTIANTMSIIVRVRPARDIIRYHAKRSVHSVTYLIKPGWKVLGVVSRVVEQRAQSREDL